MTEYLYFDFSVTGVRAIRVVLYFLGVINTFRVSVAAYILYMISGSVRIPLKPNCGLHYFHLSVVHLFLSRGVEVLMMGVCWRERKALEPLGWLGLDGMDFYHTVCGIV